MTSDHVVVYVTIFVILTLACAVGFVIEVLITFDHIGACDLTSSICSEELDRWIGYDLESRAAVRAETEPPQ